VALRGYRFAETDVLLDRLAEELRVRDELIAKLRGATPEDADAVPEAEPSEGEPSETEPEPTDDATDQPADEPHAG
jgi:hypothetical protein